MKYSDTMFSCITYIERHIQETLTAQIIANEVGYSLFHLSHIFKEEMGMSIMEYVKERKLICASYELFEGKKIIDVAIEYGYQTHSGFTKAFKKQFGFPPTFIYAMRMSCNILSESGGREVMSQERLENQGIFIKQTVDFTEPEVLYTHLLQAIDRNNIHCNLKKIEKAYHMACIVHKGEQRKSGEAYIIHPLCVANILAEMEASESCIIAGLLHEILEKDTMITMEDVKREFLDEVVQMIQEVTELNKMELEDLGEEVVKRDINSILIKLADRLHNMRTIKYMNPDQLKKKAKETIEFFSPIAIKLGISKMKTELDDLALKYL